MAAEAVFQEEDFVKILITEKLSDDIPRSHKDVYRGRIMPHKQSIAFKGDKTVGGTLIVPRASLRPNQLGMVSKGGMSVVVANVSAKAAESDEAAEAADSALERESRILQHLDHDNIIRLVLPYHEELQLLRGKAKNIERFMIIEAVKPLGFDLVTYRDMFLVERRTVPPEHIIWLVSQVHRGLEHMHSRRIVHRDLKPDNVVVDNKFNMKIIDFGMASLPGLDPQPKVENDYVAPEVNHEKLPPSIDYWGLGVLVFSMYHNYGNVRSQVPSSPSQSEAFWDQRRSPTKGECVDKVETSVINLMKGLLDQNSDDRWGCEKTNGWVDELRGPQRPPGQHAQIYRWTGAVESMFYLTLPRGCPTATLSDLRLDAMILMIDDPPREDSSRELSSRGAACCPCYARCYAWLFGDSRTGPVNASGGASASSSASSSAGGPAASGQGINVLPGASTQLRAGCKIYFAIRDDLSEDDIQKKVFEKLNAPHVLESARRGTYPSTKQNLEFVGKITGPDVDFHAVRPAFDAFAFPDYCAGANLGPNLKLREKFEIPIAALAREDGSVLWWPKWDDVVQKGDQGLVMRDMFTPEKRRKNAISMMKVERLRDEARFRETLRFDPDVTFPWLG